MRLKVTFYLDDEEGHDVIYSGVGAMGGYDIEIDEVENAPPPQRTGRLKKGR